MTQKIKHRHPEKVKNPISPIKKTVASTTPVCEPIPPRTTIATIIADSIKVKLSGLINACLVAKNEPANPPNIAPIAKAVSFVFLGLTPNDLHAISSSLKASQALPIGSLLILIVKRLVIKAKTRIK